MTTQRVAHKTLQYTMFGILHPRAIDASFSRSRGFFRLSAAASRPRVPATSPSRPAPVFALLQRQLRSQVLQFLRRRLIERSLRLLRAQRVHLGSQFHKLFIVRAAISRDRRPSRRSALAAKRAQSRDAVPSATAALGELLPLNLPRHRRRDAALCGGRRPVARASRAMPARRRA